MLKEEKVEDDPLASPPPVVESEPEPEPAVESVSLDDGPSSFVEASTTTPPPPPEKSGDESPPPPTRAIATPAPPWREVWSSAKASLPKLSMRVDKPETVGATLSRHVVYRVSTKVSSGDGSATELVTARRFSEFATLREALRERYTGLLVPPIPPKVVSMSMNKEDSTVVKSRLRLLSVFATEVSKVPWLADDAALRAFCSEGNDWQKYAKVDDDLDFGPAKNGGGAVHADETSTVGRGRASWYATIAKAPAPGNPEAFDAVLHEHLQRIDGLRAATDFTMKAAVKAAGACQVRAEALGSLRDVLSGWRGESARFASLAADVPDKIFSSPVPGSSGSVVVRRPGPTKSAERCAAVVVAAVENWSRDADADAVLIDKSLVAGPRWQDLLLVAARDLVSKRAALKDDLLKQEKHLAGLKQQKAAALVAAAQQQQQQQQAQAATASSRASKLLSYAPTVSMFKTTAATDGPALDILIAEAETLKNDKERALDLHARALAYSELDRFNHEYCANQDEWAAAFFADMADLNTQAKKTWEEAHDNIVPIEHQSKVQQQKSTHHQLAQAPGDDPGTQHVEEDAAPV